MCFLHVFWSAFWIPPTSFPTQHITNIAPDGTLFFCQVFTLCGLHIHKPTHKISQKHKNTRIHVTHPRRGLNETSDTSTNPVWKEKKQQTCTESMFRMKYEVDRAKQTGQRMRLKNGVEGQHFGHPFFTFFLDIHFDHILLQDGMRCKQIIEAATSMEP